MVIFDLLQNQKVKKMAGIVQNTIEKLNKKLKNKLIPSMILNLLFILFRKLMND